jgi:hypothetical protein
MYLCARGIYFASFYDFPLDFGIVPTVWSFLFVFQRFSHQYLSKTIIAVSIGISENGELYEIFLLDI